MDSALGPGYDYWKNIKSPSELGMSDAGTISALSNDIGGLISYVSLLVDGNSNASKTGQPLGNRFFLQTMAKCRNILSDRTKPESETNPIYVPRYIYVDNVPDGTIPFIASGPDGGKMKDFRGLIPGAIGNMAAFSPSGFYRAFTMGNYPDCVKITLRTKDNNNNDGKQTEYVAVQDILNEISRDNMIDGNPIDSISDPCKFKDYTHPVTKQQKLKRECEPESEDFSILNPNINRYGLNNSDDSDSESESKSNTGSKINETREQKEEKAALKHMRKLRRKEKKMHTSIYQYPLKMTQGENATDKVYLDDDFSSKYQVMRFHDNDNNDIDTHANNGDVDEYEYALPDDLASRLYYAAITGLGLYVLYKILYTNRKK